MCFGLFDTAMDYSVVTVYVLWLKYEGHITIVHKYWNIHKNSDCLSIFSLANTPENPAWVPHEENHTEGICVTDIGT